MLFSYFRYSQIYADLHQTISNADSDKDLTWWSQAHGIDMVMLWPTFEVRGGVFGLSYLAFFTVVVALCTSC